MTRWYGRWVEGRLELVTGELFRRGRHFLGVRLLAPVVLVVVLRVALGAALACDVIAALACDGGESRAGSLRTRRLQNRGHGLKRGKSSDETPFAAQECRSKRPPHYGMRKHLLESTTARTWETRGTFWNESVTSAGWLAFVSVQSRNVRHAIPTLTFNIETWTDRPGIKTSWTNHPLKPADN